MRPKKFFIAFLAGIVFPFCALADFTFKRERDVAVVINGHEEQVVHTAFDLLRNDYVNVFDANLKTSKKKGRIYVGTIGLNTDAEAFANEKDIQELMKHSEGFLLFVSGDKLIVLGSDKRGTAYGILELSRMIGLSPWVWWADSPIE